MKTNSTQISRIRWSLVSGVVVAICVIALLACMIWYVTSVMVLNQESAVSGQIMTSKELDLLTRQILKIDSTLHLPFGRYNLSPTPSSSL